MKWMLLGVRLVLATVFLIAGVGKIADPSTFADSIAMFQMLPAFTIPFLAVSLPVFEIILGGMLAFRSRLAAFSAVILLALYTTAFALGLLRHLPLTCDCFGVTTSAPLALLRDLVLLAGAVILYRADLKDAAERPAKDR